MTDVYPAMQSAKKRFINRKKLVESSELLALSADPAPNEALGVQVPELGVQIPEAVAEDLGIAEVMERLSAEEMKRVISLNTLSVFLKYPAVAYNNYLQELGKNRELEEKIEQIRTEGKSNREIMEEIVQLEYRDRNI